MSSLKIAVSDAPSPDIIHRFRNFGEDVYKAVQDKCAVSLDEIDAATTSFYLREVPKREARSITNLVRELFQRHNFGATGTVTSE